MGTTNQISNEMGTLNQKRPLGITIIAVLMIMIGIATGIWGFFAHNLFGLVSNGISIWNYVAAAVGALYVIAGWYLLKVKKWAAIATIVLIFGDITWHIAMILTVDYGKENLVSALVGPCIALIMAVYIASKWRFYK